MALSKAITFRNNDSLSRLQAEVVQWAEANFPNRTLQSCFMKMYEEIGEFLREPTSAAELADIFVMLLDIADMQHIDIGAAIRDKMVINRTRKWRQNPTTGVMMHVGDDNGHQPEKLARNVHANGARKAMAHRKDAS